MMTSDGTEPCPTCHGGIPRGTIALHARINELEEQLASANQRIDRLTNDCGKQKLRIRELESLVEMWKLCARGLGPAPSDSVSNTSTPKKGSMGDSEPPEPDVEPDKGASVSSPNLSRLSETGSLVGDYAPSYVQRPSDPLHHQRCNAHLDDGEMPRCDKGIGHDGLHENIAKDLRWGMGASYFATYPEEAPRTNEAIACGKGHHLSPTLRCTLATEHDGVCMYSIEAVLAACAPPAPRADKAKVEESKPNPEVYSRPECIWNYCCDPEGCIARNACQNPSRSAPRAETAKAEGEKR